MSLSLSKNCESLNRKFSDILGDKKIIVLTNSEIYFDQGTKIYRIVLLSCYDKRTGMFQL